MPLDISELNILEDFGYQNEYIREILRSLFNALDKDLENNYCLKWSKSLGLSNQSSSQRIYALQSIFNAIQQEVPIFCKVGMNC